MKAARIREPEGLEGIDGLSYEDAPRPQPAIGDALVQVRAASFTPTELMWPLSTDRAGHDRGVRPDGGHWRRRRRGRDHRDTLDAARRAQPVRGEDRAHLSSEQCTTV